MKNHFFILTLVFMICSLSSFAQKWSDLTNEEKEMKLESFIADNHKYMKDSLALSDQQITDIDNVNICYLSTLDRIDRYGKTDVNKEKFAKAITAARSVQMEAIMGTAKRQKFANYVAAKLKKAGATKHT
jgi:hypothetical protein